MNNHRAPEFAHRFLRWFCPDRLLEGIEGDLLEEFESNEKKLGLCAAKLRFWLRVISFFRPGILLRNRFSMNILHYAMVRNYALSSWRYLGKNRMYGVINILGLAMGMASALLIYEFASFEFSYDRFHPNHENLYRVTTQWNKDVTANDNRATTVAWSGDGVKAEFLQVREFSRFTNVETFTGSNAIRAGHVALTDQKIFLADPGFLRMFGFKLIAGDAATALRDPASIVITKSVAEKLFKPEDPIGKLVELESHDNFPHSAFKVTGVIEDPPANSHMEFDVLLPFNLIFNGLHSGSTYWHWDYTYCYLELQPGTDVQALEKMMSERRVALFGKEMQYYNDRIDFKLQPVTNIHLGSELKGELSLNRNGIIVKFMVTISALVLVCAYINYINLSTVKVIERRAEVGIRSVIGSTRSQLMAQLFVESAILNGSALILSVVIFRAAIPLMEALGNFDWPAWNPVIFSWNFFVCASITWLSGTILSAAYGAIRLTGLRPVDVLKGSGGTIFQRGFSVRHALIVVQFAFCVAFTVGVYAMYRQLDHMESADLGVNIDQVMTVKGYGFQPFSSFKEFSSRLQGIAGIGQVGIGSSAPGDEIIELGLRPKLRANGREVEVKMIMSDDGFFKALGMKFLGGRNFDPSLGDKHAVILNDAAVRILGFHDAESAIGQALAGMEEKDVQVIGVIRSYNQRSFRNAFDPIVYVPMWNTELGWSAKYIFARINANPENLSALIRKVDRIWVDVNPGKPMNYFFADTHFLKQYQHDRTDILMFVFFAIVAVIISCLGLFGLVAYSTLQRKKEIGVRKVMGATSLDIVFLLTREVAQLIFLASFISVPIAILALREWLDQYVFRIPIDGGLVIVPLLILFMITGTTIFMRSLRAASVNPVDNLRYE